MLCIYYLPYGTGDIRARASPLPERPKEGSPPKKEAIMSVRSPQSKDFSGSICRPDISFSTSAYHPTFLHIVELCSVTVSVKGIRHQLHPCFGERDALPSTVQIKEASGLSNFSLI